MSLPQPNDPEIQKRVEAAAALADLSVEKILITNRNSHPYLSGRRFVQVFSSEKKIIYQGEIYNNLYSGKGKLFYPNGQLKYEGEFVRGLPHGVGKGFDSSGNPYQTETFYSGQPFLPMASFDSYF